MKAKKLKFPDRIFLSAEIDKLTTAQKFEKIEIKDYLYNNKKITLKFIDQ